MAQRQCIAGWLGFLYSVLKTNQWATNKSAGYLSLVRNLTDFSDKGALPASINMQYHMMMEGEYFLLWQRRRQSIIKNVEINMIVRNWIECVFLSYIDIDDFKFDCKSAICTRSSCINVDIKVTCLLCGVGSLPDNKLISACTTDIGPKIHEQAIEMQDSKLLA